MHWTAVFLPVFILSTFLFFFSSVINGIGTIISVGDSNIINLIVPNPGLVNRGDTSTMGSAFYTFDVLIGSILFSWPFLFKRSRLILIIASAVLIIPFIACIGGLRSFCSSGLMGFFAGPRLDGPIMILAEISIYQIRGLIKNDSLPFYLLVGVLSPFLMNFGLIAIICYLTYKLLTKNKTNQQTYGQ